MAAKRPQLIPVYDSEVGPQMGLANSALQWERWFQRFQDHPGLADRLDRIGAKAVTTSRVEDYGCRPLAVS